MSDTPRTDTNLERWRIRYRWEEKDRVFVDAGFARTLERELAATLRERDEARRLAEQWRDAHHDICGGSIEGLPWE